MYFQNIPKVKKYIEIKSSSLVFLRTILELFCAYQEGFVRSCILEITSDAH